MSVTPDDSLIASECENLVQILSWILFISIVFLLSFISRNLDKALFFTLTTSAVIFFLFFVT
jgi:hypothetical protein